MEDDVNRRNKKKLYNGKVYTIKASYETDNQFGYSAYLYEIEESKNRLYRRDFGVLEYPHINNAIVVSAFPCCGKTYAYEHQNKYTILDSDSSKFSWIKDESGNNTKERNPNFISDYINHIQENIGKVDIIFVSSHLQVRQGLEDAGIRFCTVYPKTEMLNEWVGRMYRRGSSKEFIQFQIDHWDEFTNDYKLMCEPHGFGVCRLGNNEYIDLDFIRNWQVKLKMR